MYNTEACHEFAGLISACMQQGSFRRIIRAVVQFNWPDFRPSAPETNALPLQQLASFYSL